MSADDIKAKFALVRIRGTKHAQLDELVRLRHWKDAAKLKAEIDGPLPYGQVVRLDQARARR